jgi:nicotinate-nucleotide--dimethylbenzimidazole phosphoribosyltransferase
VIAIPELDRDAAARAQSLLDEKTKPRGSLGRIEELAVRLAAMQGTTEIETEPRAVVVMAADHGVSRQGVSAYPREVTAQMVANFAGGGAAISVLGRQMRAETVIVDMGVDAETDWPAAVRRVRLGRGTADVTLGPAMSEADAEAGLAAGIALAGELRSRGIRVVATGDMGIGNTTAAAALACVFTGRSPEAITGRGTGIDDEGLRRKIDVVTRALERHRPDAGAPLATLAALGGFEIAGLAGLILGSAHERMPVVLDGFIAGAAALVARGLAPASVGFMIAAHRSVEPGHAAVLEALGLEPLLDLRLRLGEGTGAVLALPLLDAACRVVREMASFSEAGVARSGGRA